MTAEFTKIVVALPCESGDCSDPDAKGEFYPVLTFSDGQVTQLSRPVCSKCRAAARVEDFLTDALWLLIVAAANDRKQTPPIRTSTKLTFASVDEGNDRVDELETDEAAVDAMFRENEATGGFGRRGL